MVCLSPSTKLQQMVSPKHRSAFITNNVVNGFSNNQRFVSFHLVTGCLLMSHDTFSLYFAGSGYSKCYNVVSGFWVFLLHEFKRK